LPMILYLCSISSLRGSSFLSHSTCKQQHDSEDLFTWLSLCSIHALKHFNPGNRW
jgi:hypothetical protein